MPQDLQAHYLKDYRPPAYLVDEVELRFDLHPSRTQVEAILQMRRNPAGQGSQSPGTRWAAAGIAGHDPGWPNPERRRLSA